jgi:hypothetical protein
MGMNEEQQLMRRLERYRAVLRLTTDPKAIAALNDRVGQTLDRLEQTKKAGIRQWLTTPK